MLPADFANLRPQGHSIEVRIYAEDPGANFFPAPGPVRAFVPAQGRGIRWELGMDTVDKISTSFDPMISKLVCTASNRTQALTLLAQTLERTSFSGPRNNIPFLIWLARHKQVTQRPVDTHFIANHIQDALAWEIDERKRLEPLALELLSTSENPGFGAMHGNHDGQQESISAKCITAMAFSKGALPQDQRLKYVQLSTRSVAWSRTEYQASCQFGTGTYSNPYTHPPNNALVFSFARHQGSNAVEHWIGLSGHNWVNVESRATSDVGTKAQSQSDGMSAPVPGKVIGIQVTEGSLVEVGQTMFILESMKMQFEVKAGKRGTIGQIMVQVGVQVQSGEQLGAWQNA
ncbi:MAG: hypothetical protein NTV34_07480 [Proteobacteria bacterium]|nr:hypothetical protein [Pseudomonadota bacterium]